jgi:hypothetical protein
MIKENDTDQTVLKTKIGELMAALDQVKKYRELSRSVIDLILIVGLSFVGALLVLISGNVYLLFFGTPGSSFNLEIPTIFVSGVIVLAGIIGSTFLIDRRVSKVKIGEWKSAVPENQEVSGTIALLSKIDWDSTFKDIQVSKIGFVVYGVLKIVGYWLFTFFLLEILNVLFISGLLHAIIGAEYVGVLALVVVLAGSWGDLKFRYMQSWSLDSLLWELRWFDSEFRREESNFKA